MLEIMVQAAICLAVFVAGFICGRGRRPPGGGSWGE